jgi:hypothetical protein
MADYTIEQWLKGKVDFNIPESAIKAILFDNKITGGTPMCCTSERDRDLCLADLLMWLSSSSTITSGEVISDGGWQHQHSNKNVFDRAGLVAKAKALYQKWNSEKADLASGVKITFKSIY